MHRRDPGRKAIRLKSCLKKCLPAGAVSALIGLRRLCRLTPMCRVMTELKRRSVRLGDLSALEIFAGSGDLHTKDYAYRVAKIALWEKNARHERPLGQTFPGAEVKITDSYEEVKRNPNRYDLIVVDNAISTYAKHCEHFGMFPDICRLAADRSILVVNVIPSVNAEDLAAYPYLFNDVQLKRRSEFYGTTHPENIPIQEMVAVYKRHFETCGFELEWSFSRRRTFVHYLVMKVGKRGGKKDTDARR